MEEIQKIREIEEEIEKRKSLEKTRLYKKHEIIIKKEQQIQSNAHHQSIQLIKKLNQSLLKNLINHFNITKDVQEVYNEKTKAKLFFYTQKEENNTEYFLEIMPHRHTTKRIFSLDRQKSSNTLWGARYQHGTSTADLIIPGLKMVIEKLNKLEIKQDILRISLDSNHLNNEEYMKAYETYLKSFENGNIRKKINEIKKEMLDLVSGDLEHEIVKIKLKPER